MTTISIAALKEKIASNEKTNLLDVREPDERAEFSIGGIFIPLGQIMAMQIDELEDLKEEEIFCYCRSGKRSMQAAMMLETMGFTKIVNVDGGMMAWQASL
jgi:rhodanese-related sulfurtransferase